MLELDGSEIVELDSILHESNTDQKNGQSISKSDFDDFLSDLEPLDADDFA